MSLNLERRDKVDITSFQYLMFIVIGITVYYSIPLKLRYKWLIILSFLFMFSASKFGFVIVFCTSFLVYKVAIMIEYASSKKKILLGAMTVCIVILVCLKYLTQLLPETNKQYITYYIVPIGISYYTLQIISYLCDVYWERIPAEQSYSRILLFTCYFPQMVQGPISKYNEMEPELFAEHKFEWKNIKYGVQLILWGFFKKMVIADRIGVVVNSIFFSGTKPYGMTVIIGLLLYGIQLYGNFSGGIDVIRGVSECFGIGMIDNFNQPFFSKSVGEFWRRWHISLGRWMKDYVFYPFSISKSMGRLKKYLKNVVGRKYANKIVMAVANILVFALVGVWHGLGTNNLGWGLYYGFLLAAGILLESQCNLLKNRLHITSDANYWKGINWVRTFMLITLGWVFDCSYSMGGAIELVRNMFKFKLSNFSMFSLTNLELVMWVLATVTLFVVDLLHERQVSIRDELSKKNYWIQLIVWIVIIQMIACFGRVPDAGGFIYENF